MAFDYGTKRIGIAVTDPLQIIATGLDTIHPNQIIDFLNAMASQRAHTMARGETSAEGGIVGLQEQLAVYRTKAESLFLRKWLQSPQQGQPTTYLPPCQPATTSRIPNRLGHAQSTRY